MDPERCWLWLARVLGPAAENAGDLLAVYGDAETILNARFGEDFSAFLTPPQLDRLQSLDPADCDRELAACRRLGVQLLYPGHPDYPAAFLKHFPVYSKFLTVFGNSRKIAYSIVFAFRPRI